jgi:hypothetical protein
MRQLTTLAAHRRVEVDVGSLGWRQLMSKEEGGEGGGVAWSKWHHGRVMQAHQVCLCSSIFSLMPALMSRLIHAIP